MQLKSLTMWSACALSVVLIGACDSDDGEVGEVRDGEGDASGSDDSFDDDINFENDLGGDGGGDGTGGGGLTGGGEDGEGMPDGEFTSIDDVSTNDGGDGGDLGPIDVAGEDAPDAPPDSEDGFFVPDLLEPDGTSGVDGFLHDSLDQDMLSGLDGDAFNDIDFDGVSGPDIEDPDGGTAHLDTGTFDGQLSMDGFLVDAPSYIDTNTNGFDIFNPTGLPDI